MFHISRGSGKPARWESHPSVNENIREEKKRKAEEALVYFTVNIFTSRHLAAQKNVMILLVFSRGSNDFFSLLSFFLE